MELFSYMFQNSGQVLQLLGDHIRLTAIAVGLSILIGVPLGILISYVKWLNKPILGFTNLIQAVPSMALLGFAIPLLGIGIVPSVVVVFLYSLLPIVKNTYIGITQIKPELIEAAKGIGMTKFQVLRKIQIPLTLPVLMAGVRISAVTAVGLMTMAAFIGAGGLGFLVFSGISSLNNGMIMAGAVPACILALFLDWILSMVEDLVTPISLQPGALRDKEHNVRIRRYKLGFIGCMAALLVVMFGVNAYHSLHKDSNVITIGTKQFSEQLILGNIMKELVEKKTDLKVEAKFGAGGTQVLFNALKNKEIDAYVDYTGTTYVDILKHKPSSNPEEVYNTTKQEFMDQYKLAVLAPMKFNNTYALGVTQETAQQYNLNTLSDLAKVAGNIKAGTTLEFLNREDGIKGLQKAYNLNFKDSVGIDGANRYLALANNEVQLVDAFSTDGLLKKYNLKVLKDDKNFFPPYYGIPIIRQEVLEQHPELKDVLETVGPHLDDKTMQDLNYQVDEEHKSPEEVAHNFLVEKGLI